MADQNELTLEEMAKRVENLRLALLFGGSQEEATGHLGVLAEQEYLSAIAHLQLAQAAFMRAHYHQVRALAASPYRP